MYTELVRKKKRRTRPTVHEALICVRLPQPLKDQLQAIAEAEGRPFSNFVRYVLDQEVKRRRTAS